MKTSNKLPENFLYSQQSLSAFEQCPMLFKRRYIDGLRWDNVFDAEQKKAIERGMDFHLLARRYFLGVEPDPDSMGAEDDRLSIWLHNLRQDFRLKPDAVYQPEHTITMNEGRLKLQAVPDLLVKMPGRLEIWDWKTHNQMARAEAERIGNRHKSSLQTRVYLFLLREYSGSGQEISMNYWQPEPPGVIAEIVYNEAEHEDNRRFLENRISEIENYSWEAFDKLQYGKTCRHCEFNWLCNGGLPSAANQLFP